MLHYLAIAKSVGVDFNIEDFQKISDRVRDLGDLGDLEFRPEI